MIGNTDESSQLTAPPSAAPPPGASERSASFGHIPALDGIRGLAILLVLIVHLMSSNYQTGSRLFDILNDIRGSFFLGVDLFFALSGFLITNILFESLDRQRYFAKFYINRALRIFPLYYGFLFLILLFTIPMGFSWSGWQYYFLTYTQNLAVWHDLKLLKIGLFSLNHFWSLQVEEQFYLIWPLIIYNIRKPEKIVRVSLIGCLIIFLFRVLLVAMSAHPDFPNKRLTYSLTFSCADQILFGCCLAALLRTRWRETALRIAPAILLVSGAVLAIASIIYGGLDKPNNAFVPTFGYSLIAVFCSALIAMALRPASRTKKIFENDTLRFFGKYSYGIYIFHPSLDNALTPPLRSFFYDHAHSKALSVAVTSVIVGLACVVVALLSYNLFEIHFLNLKSRFRYDEPAPRGTSLAQHHDGGLTLARQCES